VQADAEITELFRTAIRDGEAILAAADRATAIRWRRRLYRWRGQLLNTPESDTALALLAPLISISVSQKDGHYRVTLTLTQP
jgi:hypothetical protein